MGFRADQGGNPAGFMLKFNELLTEVPGVEKLKEGIVLSDCQGLQLLIPDVVCSQIAQVMPTGINFMSLDPIFELFPTGDVNRDFRVGFDDFLALSANFGTAPGIVTGPGAATVPAATAAVPEPSSMMLLGIGLLFLRRRRLSR